MITICIVLTIVIWALVIFNPPKSEQSNGMFDIFFMGIEAMFKVGLGIVCTLVVWLIYFIIN